MQWVGLSGDVLTLDVTMTYYNLNNPVRICVSSGRVALRIEQRGEAGDPASALSWKYTMSFFPTDDGTSSAVSTGLLEPT